MLARGRLLMQSGLDLAALPADQLVAVAVALLEQEAATDPAARAAQQRIEGILAESVDPDLGLQGDMMGGLQPVGAIGQPVEG